MMEWENDEIWDLAMEDARESLGYRTDEWVDDYSELLETAKDFYGGRCQEIREENYEKYIEERKEYHRYLKSNQWKILREKVLKKFNFKCIDCCEVAEAVHHKSYENLYTEEEEYDCVAICNVCHMKRHDFCEAYNKDNIFHGDCYMCGKKKLILRVDSWSGKKLEDDTYLRGSWRNFCEDCCKEWGWSHNRKHNKCINCFRLFIGAKKQSKCEKCSVLNIYGENING